MRKTRFILAASTFSLLAAFATATAARGMHTVNGRSVILVTPSGDILDYVPEAGTVEVRRDQLGRRVLVDRNGNIVAIEMPAERDTRRTEDNRGWGFGQAPWDAAPATRDDQRGQNDLTTGTLPDGQYEPGPPVDSQPLPDLPNDSEQASLGPNDSPAGVLQDNLESPAPRISMTGKSSADVAALEVLLDRAGMSPGVIDGKMGSNVEKALHAYEVTTGDRLDPRDTDGILRRLANNGGLPFQQYTITAADAAGPYVASIPSNYALKATMPSLGYTSSAEMLAERFHMDENYLKSLNPNADFSKPGTVIKVVNPGEDKTGTVTRIVANKSVKEVQAFNAQGELVAAYPATIGSTDTPSPSGTHTVTRIAFNPDYTYNPKINFRQGDNNKVLTIPPGPNGPVGDVWIALSKPTYGIHGTPEPSLIGKTASHGCVRLTNWDAEELARMVKPGTIVQFVN